MHSVLFAIKRFFIFLADCVIWPFTNFAELWRQPDRGRALILGIPGIVIGLISLIAVIYAGVGSKRQFAKAYNDAAKQAQEDEEWTEAIAHLRKLSDLLPKDNQVKMRLAEALRKDENDETRASNLRLSESIMRMLAPDDKAGDPDAHVYRANVMLRQQPLTAVAVQNAEKHLRMAIEAEETHHNARVELAKLMVAMRKFPEAEELYRGLFEEYEAYVFPLVDVLRVQRKFDQARPLLEEAIRRYKRLMEEDENNVDYIRRLANCHGHLGEFEEGVRILQDGLERFEDDSFKQRLINVNLSNMYFSWAVATGQTNPALDNDEIRASYFDLLKKSFEAFPDNARVKVVLTQLGLMNVQPESRMAKDLYDAFANPDDAPDEVLYQIGTDQILNGDKQLGISLLEKGLEKNPNNRDILNNLAYSLIETDNQRALDLANRALAIAPNNPHYRDTRGNIFMKMEEYSRAIGDFEQALLDPVMKNNPEIYESIIECYKQQQMFSDADLYQRRLEEIRSQTPEEETVGGSTTETSTDSGNGPGN